MIRSAGCKTCRQRRVKCDETWPVCTNCGRAGRQCPGPQVVTLFIDETPKIKKQHGLSTTKASNDRPITNIEDRSESSEKDVDEKLKYLQIRRKESIPAASTATTSKSSLEPSPPSRIRSPRLELLQLLECLAGLMSPPQQVYLWDAQKTESGVFPRLIRSSVDTHEPRAISLLEAAMRALALAHEGRLAANDQAATHSFSHYGRALRLLSQALEDPQGAGRSREVLTTTVLLSFYEAIQSNVSVPFIKHAGGVGSLLKMRGPAMHRFGFGREMFLTYQHLAVLQALETGTACFLDQPEWQALMTQLRRDNMAQRKHEPHPELRDIASRSYLELISFPALVQDVRMLPILMEQASDPQAVMDDLAEKINIKRDRLKSLFAQALHCLRTIGYPVDCEVYPDPVFPNQYRFVNFFIGRWFITHHVLQIISNSILSFFEPDVAMKVKYEAENYKHATAICQSWANMHVHKLVGVFMLAFGLQVSLAPFKKDMVKRRWVITKLLEMAGTKVGIAAEIEPHDPQEDVTVPGIRNVLKEAEAFAR